MHKVIFLMAALGCLLMLSACAKKQQTVIEQTAKYMRAGLESQPPCRFVPGEDLVSSRL